jgi:hypothetical protein
MSVSSSARAARAAVRERNWRRAAHALLTCAGGECARLVARLLICSWHLNVVANAVHVVALHSL